jgi:hypothetical protein
LDKPKKDGTLDLNQKPRQKVKNPIKLRDDDNAYNDLF